MLFGDPSDFAIEAVVEPHLEPPSSVWGRMCVWCRSVPLGDITEPQCALYPAYCEFRVLPSLLEELWSMELEGLGDLDAWNLLDGLLYGYHGDVEVPDDRSVEQCGADWSEWGKFNFLTNWGEQFDHYKSFLVCPPGGPVRILSRRLPTALGLGVDVTKEAVIKASQEFVHWFVETELRLGGIPAGTPAGGKPRLTSRCSLD